MNFINKIYNLFKSNKPMTQQEKERLDKIKRIQRKAKEIASPWIEEMRSNRLEKGDSGVELNSNSWVVKSHNYNFPEYDLKID